MAAMVQATIDNLPRKTRARAHAIKQNALEAGILLPEKKAKARKPVLVTHIGYGSDEDSDVEPDDIFEQDVKTRNPWPQVQKLESMMAWSVWNTEQDELDKVLVSPEYMMGPVKPPCPYSMRDLAVRVDNCVRDSPRTFEPEIHHWRDSGLLLRTLQEYGNGREHVFLKMKVPKHVLALPIVKIYRLTLFREALIPAIGNTHLARDVSTINHRLRLEKLPRHSKSAAKGIYRVKLSLNPYEDSTLTWRAVFADYEREVAESEMTAASTDSDHRLERLVKSHYERQEKDAQLRKAQQHLVKEAARLDKERQLRRRRQDNSGSSQASLTTSPERRIQIRETTLFRSRTEFEAEVGSEDQVQSNEALSSKNLTPSPIKSEDPSATDIQPLPGN
ncbi:MAG: hypothetical protein Q9213_006755 [Squamulea squamosa]